MSAAQVHVQSGSFALAVGVAVAVTAAVAALLEVTLMRRLYGRDHLAQVLATFGVILVADDAVKMIWGPSPVMASAPAALAGPVELFAGLPYSFVPAAGAGRRGAGGAALYLLVNHSRAGHAGCARARPTAGWPSGWGFASTASSAAFLCWERRWRHWRARSMAPLVAVQVGMGESILIPALVVIVIGGIGSVRGAFLPAMLVGLVDTIRPRLPLLLRATLPPALAAEPGPACWPSLSMYVFMAVCWPFALWGCFLRKPEPFLCRRPLSIISPTSPTRWKATAWPLASPARAGRASPGGCGAGA